MNRIELSGVESAIASGRAEHPSLRQRLAGEILCGRRVRDGGVGCSADYNKRMNERVRRRVAIEEDGRRVRVQKN